MVCSRSWELVACSRDGRQECPPYNAGAPLCLAKQKIGGQRSERSRELSVLGYPLKGSSRSWELVGQVMAGRNAKQECLPYNAGAPLCPPEEGTLSRP